MAFDALNIFLKGESNLTETLTSAAFDAHGPQTGPVRVRLVVPAIAAAADTLNVKVQEGDTATGSFSDVASFPQVTGAAAAGDYFIKVQPKKRWIRAVFTVSGAAPNFGKVICGYESAGRYDLV